MANSTLHIEKVAIGFRYRPRGGTGIGVIKKPVEITLEYGPQRVGEGLDHDAVPLVQVDESSDSTFFSWDNVGRVYYTTKIVSEKYLSSYYMASMTGTVLEQILEKAVQFAEKRRRYQPFAVYAEETDQLLKSSSSQDFNIFVWDELARLGVEIEPILPPPIYEARLWAKSVTKVIPEGNVAHDAAIFYYKLYSCLTAIAMNDYSKFEPTAQPTISPSPTSQSMDSLSPSVELIDSSFGDSISPHDGENKKVGNDEKAMDRDEDSDINDGGSERYSMRRKNLELTSREMVTETRPPSEAILDDEEELDDKSISKTPNTNQTSVEKENETIQINALPKAKDDDVGDGVLDEPSDRMKDEYEDSTTDSGLAEESVSKNTDPGAVNEDLDDEKNEIVDSEGVKTKKIGSTSENEESVDADGNEDDFFTDIDGQASEETDSDDEIHDTVLGPEGESQDNGKDNNTDTDDIENDVGVATLATSLPTISNPPSTTQLPTSTPSSEVTSSEINPDADAEKAKEAAQEAKKAADEAKNAAQTDVENKAADAAQAAADAAKKAADSTAKAAAQAAMDGLLNGDGAMMTNIISTTCFANLQYGIASLDEEGNLTSHAFLYRDGSLYWKLEMIPPYFTIEKVNHPLPKAADMQTIGGGGDLLDWTLAFVVLFMILFGIVVIVQQMNIKLFEKLYHLQRWFFNPTKYDYEGDLHIDSNASVQFDYGEDGVPISMGGKRTVASRYRDRTDLQEIQSIRSNTSLVSSSSIDSSGDVELCEINGPLNSMNSNNDSIGTRNKRVTINTQLSTSYSNEESYYSKRFMRNPDLVDFPNLSSNSKVATPVCNPSTLSQISGRSDTPEFPIDDLLDKRI
jgi:hypothetical protein